MSWRKKVKADLEKKEKSTEQNMEVEETESSEDEEEAMDAKIAELQEEEAQALKKKRKQVMKEKRKLRDKMALNMVIPGDTLEVTDDMELFNIKKIKKKHQLEKVGEAEMESSASEESDSDEVRENRMVYDRDSKTYVDEIISDDEELDEESDDEDENSDEDEEEDSATNPLVVDLESKDVIQSRKAQMWFNKGAFDGLDIDADEEVEISRMIEDYKSKGGKIQGAASTKNLKRKREVTEVDPDSGRGSDDELSESDLEDDEDGSGSDYDEHAALGVEVTSDRRRKTQSNKDGFEIVPVSEPASKIIKLDPVGLAVGEELVKSKKRRRELIEQSYNRYTYNDENLPDWFVKDEARHCIRQLPVTKEQINAYKEKTKAIDARAPKKVIEAKARKKRKAMKKLEKARKKAEVITENAETSEKEKWSQIKQVYKKAGLLNKKKRQLTYVVAKKGAGKKVSRPAGVKGQFKVVDPRMKKDMRKQKANDRNSKKRGGRHAKGKTRK